MSDEAYNAGVEQLEECVENVIRLYNRSQMLAAEGPNNPEEWTAYGDAYSNFQDAMEVLAQEIGLEAWSDTGE